MNEQSKTLTFLGIAIGFSVLAAIFLFRSQPTFNSRTQQQPVPIIERVILTSVDGRITAINGRQLEVLSTIVDGQGNPLTYTFTLEANAHIVKRTMKSPEQIDALRDENGYLPPNVYVSDETRIDLGQLTVGDKVIANGLPDANNAQLISVSLLAVDNLSSNADMYQPVR